nr:hypothetical protein [uncultured Flavobacterium sp.]
MSWFSRQFEKKAGGSMLGNMWRRTATRIADNLTLGFASSTFDMDNNGMLDFIERK